MKHISLAHGSGGVLTHDLVRSLFLEKFGENPKIQTDSMILDLASNQIAYTTDSFVVDPVFFPGGDIGKLAVAGTVNDLAVSGAIPKFLSAGYIIEEGFEMEKLKVIVDSMAKEASRAGVRIVTGDTKVVDKGKCDKIFINTSGIGILDSRFLQISSASKVRDGDVIILNGTIADHGISVISKRNGISFEKEIESDCASLNHMIQKVLSVCPEVKFMRDCTRGGLATVLVELSEMTGLGIRIDEAKIPIKAEVKGACDILGFDPLYIANEGKIVIVVSENDKDKVLGIMHNDEFGKDAMDIGFVDRSLSSLVVMKTKFGGERIVDMLTAEQLPRIC